MNINIKQVYENAIKNGLIKNTYLNDDLFISNLLQNAQDGIIFKVKKQPSTQQELKIAKEKFASVEKLFKNHDQSYFDNFSETDIRTKLITPTLGALGFYFKEEATLQNAGIPYKPDYILFSSQSAYNDYMEHGDESSKEGWILLEAKKWNIRFDNIISAQEMEKNQDASKSKNVTPQRQLLNAMFTNGIKKGILCNGKKWWFYDTSVDSKNAQIIGFDLYDIVNSPNSQLSFEEFYFTFNVKNFRDNVLFDDLNAANQNKSKDLENNLKDAIYGENSILETIGKKISTHHRDANIKDVYHNSLIMLFRIIFMCFYENKYKSHISNFSSYGIYSIYEFYNNLKNNKIDANFKNLLKRWEDINAGDERNNIPMLNGGLFAPQSATLLNTTQFSNDDLLHILSSLIDNNDYKNLSIQQFGNIYEGLLQYGFQIAKNEVHFVRYKLKTTNGYVDSYEFIDSYYEESYNKGSDNITNYQKINTYKKGELYLSTLSNQRKTTASYYTPQMLSGFMVEESINYQLNTLNKNPLDLKIIDNACGSGHFLSNALSTLASEALKQEHFNKIQATFHTEKEIIYNNLRKIVDETAANSQDIYPSDELIVKRMLLKRCIYGVDLNPIAVEIAKISLWVDTFIFGTPLSLIEHHIKVGNSLIYTSKNEYEVFFEEHFAQGDFFANNNTEDFKFLEEKLNQVSKLTDLEQNDVEKSKTLYKEAQEIINKLNIKFNFVNYYNYKAANKEKINVVDEYNALENNKNLKYNKFVSTYKPFNIYVEFKDANGEFDVVLGNPPWDKTKLSEADFYATYISNYKSLTHGQKKQKQDQLKLSFSNIGDDFNQAKEDIVSINAYYKAKYPNNRGAGDGNLFQFFLERNLQLLKPKGNMYYLTPSLWSFADTGLNIRQHIFNNYCLSNFYELTNKKNLFNGVASNYKFAIYNIINTRGTTTFNTLFYQVDDGNFKNSPAQMVVSLDDIKAISPKNMAILSIQSPMEKDIITHIYGKFKPLDDDYIQFTRELDMTNHKAIMIEQNSQKWHNNLLKMHEGKTINQYNVNWGDITYWVDPNSLKDALPAHKHNNFKHFRLAFRDIASATNERSLIACILPKNTTYGNTLTASIPQEHVSINKLLFLQGLFNSLTLDFIIRLYIDLHISLTYLKKLPLPQPPQEELSKVEAYKKIITKSATLSYIHSPQDFQDFVSLYNIDVDYIKSLHGHPMERYIHELQSDMDVEVFKIYGLTSEQAKYIISTFNVLKNKQPQYIALLLGKLD